MDLTTFIVNLAGAISEFQSLAGAVAFGVGLYFIYLAITKGMKATRSAGNEASGSSIFVLLIVGGLLMDLSGTMGGAFSSLSGEEGISYQMVSYSGVDKAGAFSGAINAILTIVSTFGWWYGLQGFAMFKKASEGGGHNNEDYAWKGLMHVLGGAMLINITSTIEAFKETTGLIF